MHSPLVMFFVDKTIISLKGSNALFHFNLTERPSGQGDMDMK